MHLKVHIKKTEKTSTAFFIYIYASTQNTHKKYKKIILGILLLTPINYAFEFSELEIETHQPNETVNINNIIS